MDAKAIFVISVRYIWIERAERNKRKHNIASISNQDIEWGGNVIARSLNKKIIAFFFFVKWKKKKKRDEANCSGSKAVKAGHDWHYKHRDLQRENKD